LVDQQVSSEFEEYHRLHAELRPLLKAANVAKGGWRGADMGASA
jgi:hypothetical protein